MFKDIVTYCGIAALSFLLIGLPVLMWIITFTVETSNNGIGPGLLAGFLTIGSMVVTFLIISEVVD